MSYHISYHIISKTLNGRTISKLEESSLNSKLRCSVSDDVRRLSVLSMNVSFLLSAVTMLYLSMICTLQWHNFN